ncbi:ABC transporter permease [Robbsia sp. KACC 23696]|uniref:ABC transporter permease n=1 Tax=Robbsia sp. KACC 23696 TaxID=3149231 RepID=UPI00325AD2C1
MNATEASALLSSTVVAAVPLMLAGLGELVVEKSGVINLGVEGMMLVGAVSGYAIATSTGDPWLGIAGAIVAGMAMALVFAFVTIGLRANQIATGLALTIFGTGLSAYIGKPYTSAILSHSIGAWPIPVLSTLPVVGPAFFSLSPISYLAFLAFPGVAWFLYRTKAGLTLRAVGEAPEVAHAMGFPVQGIRYASALFGGAMAGLAGGYYAIVYLHVWQEQLTAGRGWIALALVVFATWRPFRLLAGALIFGAVTAGQFFAQGSGLAVPTQFLAMLPYIVTIVVLVLMSRNQTMIRLNAPASLGKSSPIA